jgi:hypothetical protein
MTIYSRYAHLTMHEDNSHRKSFRQPGKSVRCLNEDVEPDKDSHDKIARILFATNLLENCRLVLDFAAASAEHFKAPIVMVHAVQLSGAAHATELQSHRLSRDKYVKA